MSKKYLASTLIIVLSLLIMMIVLPSLALANTTYFGQIPSGYEKSCNLCHSTAPALNKFGTDFKAAGYKFPSKTTTTTTTTKPATTTTTTTKTTTTATTVAKPVVKPAPPAPKGVTEREFSDILGSVKARNAFYPANPSAVITREGAAEYLVALIGLTEKAEELKTADLDKAFEGFSDGKEIGKAKAVAMAVKQGLLKGYPTKFNPKGIVTKEQATVIANRLSGYKSGIVTPKWAASKHADTVKETNADGSIVYMALRDTCLACHSGEGFSRELTKAADLTDQKNPVAIGCSNCHSDRGKKIMAEGKAVIAAPKSVSATGKYTVTDAGAGALCMTCHQHRRDGIDSSSRKAPHPATQSQVLLGIAGLEDQGVIYSNSPHAAVPGTCEGCHLAKDENGVRNHAYKLTDDMTESACGSCHAGLETLDRPALGDYDGDGSREGIQEEVEGLLALVKGAIETSIDGGKGGTFSEGGGGFAFKKKDGTALDNTKDISNDLYKATWNYQVV
ncbi:MAG: S-layer homology domain-containing protein, partial [Bacillota bacterium]